jgi:putative hydrolase of the HAD superfamily
VGGIRAVLVDLYDTLLWSDWPVMRAEMERRFGLDEQRLIQAFVDTRAARSVGVYPSAEEDLKAVLRAAGVEPEDDVIHDYLVRYRSEGLHLWDDSVPTLRALRDRGVRTAIVSNCDHSTRPAVEELGLDAEVDAMVLSYEVGAAKPDPRIYGAALQAVDVAAADAVFVDDQARYVEGAIDAGMRGLLVIRDDATPAEGVSDPGGLDVVPDLRSVLEMV